MPFNVGKSIFSKLWFPAAVIVFATVQTFGMEYVRNRPFLSPVEKADTVIYTNEKTFTKFRSAAERAKEQDSTFLDLSDAAEDTLPRLTARDTIHAPDSLKETDPFRYKYYVALLDSLTHVQVRDSLKAAGDTLDWPRLDSLYYADSTTRARAKFLAWYNSLDKKARKNYDFEQKMKLRQRQMDSILAVKDSLQYIKDSIVEYTPRILSTYALPDSMQYKRIITWNRDNLFAGVKLKQLDTSFNYYFNDYPFMREDVGASYLGIVGSAVQQYDFFRRTSREGISFYAPYEVYSFSPGTLPMYNTKTPYTELAYWGTLFANTEQEESDIHILTTQNILPELNMMLRYDRFGANGMLENEDVDNRTFAASLNWLGKKYAAHGGYIYNKMAKSENGGLIDSFWIRDTTVGPREIAVHLTDASTLIKKNTLFLDQTYRIPFTFIKDLIHRKDSTYVPASRDSLDTDVTTAFIGHSSEYSVYRKTYADNIGAGDSQAREFYHNNFYLNPTVSADSIRVMKFENRIFAKLQPWSSDAVVSSINAGIGDRILNHYLFQPSGWISPVKNTVWNSLYLYGGAGGNFRQFLSWNAEGYFTFLGEEAGDTGLSADANMNFFPFRRHRKSPLSLNLHFETTLDEPDFYEQHYFSNHYRWENQFSKKSTTKVEGSVRIPHWDMEVSAGYSLLSGNIYYDTLGVVRQNSTPMSVAKLGVMKNFQLWKFHFDNRALLQVSSNEDVMPLPQAALNLKWYIQLHVMNPAKTFDALKIQLGVNGLYTTRWHAPAYNPAVGAFHNQNSELIGGCPYFDVFANLQWKRACIFVKLLNAGMGWPMEHADYFSARGYIRSQRAFKFGIYWPFYMQTKKATTMSSHASSMGGGGGRSGGRGR